MLHYPKIQGASAARLERCIAFEKIDGTNLHWSWDRDFGWHAFGTRRDSFNLTPQGVEQFAQVHAQLHEAPVLFQTTLAAGLERNFLDNPTYQPVAGFKVFTEFLGPNSFAGLARRLFMLTALSTSFMLAMSVILRLPASWGTSSSSR